MLGSQFAWPSFGVGDSLDRGDTPDDMGDNLPEVRLGAGRKAIAITSKFNHTCALLDDRSVKCWGYNESGQLGLGDGVNRGTQLGQMGDNLPRVPVN